MRAVLYAFLLFLNLEVYAPILLEIPAPADATNLKHEFWLQPEHTDPIEAAREHVAKIEAELRQRTDEELIADLALSGESIK